MSQVHIVIADDHQLFAETLAERLEAEANIVVDDRCPDAEHALAACTTHRPDVAVLDIDMPGRPSFDVAEHLSNMRPPVAVLMLSAHVHDTFISRALGVGVRGYLTKRSATSELVDAISEIARGGTAFSDEIGERLVLDDDGLRLDQGEGRTRRDTLTGREFEVLELVARGQTAREIAAALHIAVKTVDKHTQSLMRKLAVHNRVELTRYAIREGIVQP
ncbi:MAG: response regulator [Phycisphaerales bacterium]